ncbi:Superoxide dismutase-like protein [Swinepox virus]|uniref:Superoxide dismutase-like protein n=1 Tax=Swinepox virus TaxID=10276 RepID=A0A881SY99_SWPV|nr:Superoxide dismutase-like protein [Swinepox virus]
MDKYYAFNLVKYKAVCVIKGRRNDIHGIININQLQNDIVIISGVIIGLCEGYHGLHIHEFGDETDDVNSLGKHFNPDNKNHGSQYDTDRHVGDLGNITANKYGVSYVYKIDGRIQLRGNNSIIGRSLVISQYADDLGKGENKTSLIDGNSGESMAWGIIGIIQ